MKISGLLESLQGYYLVTNKFRFMIEFSTFSGTIQNVSNVMAYIFSLLLLKYWLSSRIWDLRWNPIRESLRVKCQIW